MVKRCLICLLVLMLLFGLVGASFASEPLDIVDFYAGGNFVHAKTSTGDWYSWGKNDKGQLGLGDNSEYIAPVLSSNMNSLDIVDLYVGGDFSIAKTSTGDWYVWGDNYYGQLGLGDNLNKNVPTLNSNMNSLDIVDLYISNQFVYVKTSTGDWYSWGRNTLGVLLLGDSVNKNVPTLNSNMNSLDVVDLYLLEIAAFAKTSTGDWYSWGHNSYGQLGLGDNVDKTSATLNSNMNLLDISSLYLSGKSVFAKTLTGDWYSWGYNGLGGLGLGDLDNRNLPTLNSNMNSLDISDLYISGYANSLKTSTDDWYVWGYNANGQLGLDDTTNRNVPTINTLMNSLDFLYIFQSDLSVFGITSTGDWYAWGRNNGGQLGLGDKIDKYLPTSNLLIITYDVSTFGGATEPVPEEPVPGDESGDVASILSYINPFSEYFFLKIAFVPSEGFFLDKFNGLLNSVMDSALIADFDNVRQSFNTIVDGMQSNDYEDFGSVYAPDWAALSIGSYNPYPLPVGVPVCSPESPEWPECQGYDDWAQGSYDLSFSLAGVPFFNASVLGGAISKFKYYSSGVMSLFFMLWFIRAIPALFAGALPGGSGESGQGREKK